MNPAPLIFNASVIISNTGRLLAALTWVLVGSSCRQGVTELSHPPIARYVAELRRDLQEHGAAYNPDIACYVDLTRPDNSYRFYVLDLAHGTILLKGMCLNGLTDAWGQVRYSNAINSNCSSRGLACIGELYTGAYGRAFRLYGLEASTRNLRKRAVVLHSWAGVPARPSSAHMIQSQGCPTLNPQVLDTVAYYIARSPKPLLLRFH